MIRNMRRRFKFRDRVSDWQPRTDCGCGASRQTVREVVATYPPEFNVETDDAGNMVIYRERTIDAILPDVVSLSGGIDDRRPSKLRDALARLNRRNAEVWRTE